MSAAAFICDGARTPIGRYSGSLASVRADDLGAMPIAALIARHQDLDWGRLGDVIYGCANQAGEDNRNIARMSALLAGLPVSVPGVTVNRLCGSGMDAAVGAARLIACGDAELVLAGGVESMSRAPFVLSKSDKPFSRGVSFEDSTLGWRFVNPRMERLYGTDSMPETAENVAALHDISREDQDVFALASQQKARAAQKANRFAAEIIPVEITRRGKEPLHFAVDEHPRGDTTLEALQKLSALFREQGVVTAGNSSGVNDGSCCLLLASEAGARAAGLELKARIVAAASVGCEPRIMGMGPLPAARLALERAGLDLDDIALIELNEAFAAQVLAVTRGLGLVDDDPRVNPNGGAIALGHPLGASGARLLLTAAFELERRAERYALCAMCIGVGQGIAVIIERV